MQVRGPGVDLSGTSVWAGGASVRPGAAPDHENHTWNRAVLLGYVLNPW